MTSLHNSIIIYFKMSIQELINENNKDIKTMLEKECCEKTFPLNQTILFLYKVEKLILNSIKANADSSIYPKLIAKYDELMLKSYDQSAELVLLEEIEEGQYINFCRNSVERRTILKAMCDEVITGVKFE